jgi:Leucine-rich repeat (LRR) protein
MMKLTTIVLCILSLGGPLLADPVYFADANLKAAVEAELGISNPEPSDMLALTSLSDSVKGITDLTGLEYATNLTELYLPQNQISNLSPLSGLTKLTSLTLYSNQISSISALAGLTNLEFVHLGWN